MAILSKKALLSGSKHVEKVELSVGGEVYIRPLNQAEVTEYNRITAKALGVMETGRRNTNFKINVEKSTVANADAQAYAITTSLNCKDEEWTIDEVLELDGALFKEIFEHVANLSGLDTNVEEEVEQFPEKS